MINKVGNCFICAIKMPTNIYIYESVYGSQSSLILRNKNQYSQTKEKIIYLYQVACRIDRLENLLANRQVGAITKARPRNSKMLSIAAKLTILPLGTYCHCGAIITFGLVLQLYAVITATAMNGCATVYTI